MLTGRLVLEGASPGLIDLALASGRVYVRLVDVVADGSPRAGCRPVVLEPVTARTGLSWVDEDDGSGPVVLVHVAAPREEAEHGQGRAGTVRDA